MADIEQPTVINYEECDICMDRAGHQVECCNIVICDQCMSEYTQYSLRHDSVVRCPQCRHISLVFEHNTPTLRRNTAYEDHNVNSRLKVLVVSGCCYFIGAMVIIFL